MARNVTLQRFTRPLAGRRPQRPPAPAILVLARRLAEPHLRPVLALQMLRLGAGIGGAGALAQLVAGLLQGRAPTAGLLAGLAVGLLGAALFGLLAERRIARGEAAVADALLDRAATALAERPVAELEAREGGALVASLQRHPAAIARLCVGHAAARTMMALGPVLVAAAVAALASAGAALVLLLATPLMILGFALAGGLIRERARRQEASFGRLAAQFSDRLRALPTIIANAAVGHEAAKLDSRLAAYAEATVGVLAAAFLNAAVLDVFAALTVALLALGLGLGHLGLLPLPGLSGLPLAQSLLALLLAPDYVAPFRRYAEQYHAKAEGGAAAEALDWILAAPTEAPAAAEGPVRGRGFGTRGLELAHVGPVPDIDLPRRGLVALCGPSGVGKTSLLRALAGIDSPRAGQIRLPGRPAAGGPCAGARYAAVESFVPAGRLGDLLPAPVGGASADPATVTAARALLEDAHWPAGLATAIAAGGENLSGGQRLRLAVARLVDGGRVVFADEPTAKLDPAGADRVAALLTQLARRRLVIVTTHDPALMQRADRCIHLGDAAGGLGRSIAA